MAIQISDIAQEVLNKASPAVRSSVESQLRKDLEDIESDQDKIDYLWDSGLDIVREANKTLRTMTPAQLEQELENSTVALREFGEGSERGKEAREKYMGFIQEKKRRANQAFEDQRAKLLHEGAVRRQTEKDYQNALESAKYAEQQDKLEAERQARRSRELADAERAKAEQYLREARPRTAL